MSVGLFSSPDPKVLKLGIWTGVASWNIAQYTGFVERTGTYAPGFLASHNITTIPNNYRWAITGYQYGGE